MNRSHNRNATPISTEAIAAKKSGGRLRCRDCREYSSADQAIRRRGGNFGCPKCGSLMDREAEATEPSQVDVGITAAILAEVATRIQAGATINGIAKGAGIPQPALHRFAAGERGISLETADKLCRFLGLRLLPDNQPEAKSA